MYESPIIMNYTDPVIKEIQNRTEEYVLQAVYSCGVNVDKDELIKALQYDRDQYDKGHADGFIEGYRQAKDEIRTQLIDFIKGGLNFE